MITKLPQQPSGLVPCEHEYSEVTGTGFSASTLESSQSRRPMEGSSMLFLNPEVQSEIPETSVVYL